MTSAALAPVCRLTYADWLASPDDGLRREIIEGELYVSPPPAVTHQRVSRDIEFELLTYLRDRGTGEGFELNLTEVFAPR